MEPLQLSIEIYKDNSLKTTDSKVINGISDILHHFLTIRPYKEQIKAAIKMYKGYAVEMATGEGKTLAILIAALFLTRENRKVYIVTSNDYLSKRDFDFSKEIFKALEIKSVVIPESVGGSEDVYEKNNIIYATGNTLIFDYLRGIKDDRDFVIIDEIDYALIECANHDFSVADGSNNVIMPNEIFIQCFSIANIFSYSYKKESIKNIDYLFDLQNQNDFLVDSIKRTVEITERGYRKLNDIFGKQHLLAIEILNAVLVAKHILKKDIDYIVSNGEIVIIDSANGRISPKGRNDILLHTAIEVKEGLQVTAKSLLNNTCSFPVFFDEFKSLAGISGTSSLGKNDLEIIYKKNIVKIPSHFPCARVEHFGYFEKDLDRLTEIKNILSKHKEPLLIITDSDARTTKINEFLCVNTDKKIFVLDNLSLQQEEHFLGSLTENTVLISSKIVGRGTDISVDGLVVIIAQRFLSRRTERQAIGRAGRNGKKGTCYILTSNEDDIFKLCRNKKFKMNEPTIVKLQEKYEEKMFEQRKHIYLRSKLFFDQDKAIKDTINEFVSYEDIKKKLNNSHMDHEQINKIFRQTNNLLDAAIKYKFQFSEIQKQVLLKLYEKLRPYFQQQFLSYNDNMANTLYITEEFNNRCKEYVITGQEILLQIIYSFLLPIVKGKLDERKGLFKGKEKV